MKYFFIIVTFFSFLSCNDDVTNIVVKGTVKDEVTSKPIPNIDVTIICWKYGDSPDQSYTEDEEKVVKTDNEGKYKVDFDKGAFVEVKVTLSGYIEGHETKEIYQKENTIDISLKKN